MFWFLRIKLVNALPTDAAKHCLRAMQPEKSHAKEESDRSNGVSSDDGPVEDIKRAILRGDPHDDVGGW